MIISVIGAGGKTTLVHRLADRYIAEGRKVLLTTTTHMALEADTDISCDIAKITAKLNANRYCMAGRLCDNNPASIQAQPGEVAQDSASQHAILGEAANPAKIQALPDEVFRLASAQADITIVEADGANHHSVKYPADHEPAIAINTDIIYIVMGLFEIGAPVKDIVFRHQLFCEETGMSEGAMVDFGIIKRIVEEGYMPRIRAEYPEAEIRVLYTDWDDGKLVFHTQQEIESIYEERF